jgi:nicotinate phosphoribosyltransferase
LTGTAVSDTLATDLYEVTMALAYLHEGMTEPATFSLFTRRLPPDRGFLVAAGLEDALAYLERLRVDNSDVAALASALGRPEDEVAALRDLRFTGDVWAVPEGRVVLAGEPLLEVTAPLPQAQLVETVLFNQLTYQTAVASKAARCVLAARDLPVIDFSLRRTHGRRGRDARGPGRRRGRVRRYQQRRGVRRFARSLVTRADR